MNLNLILNLIMCNYLKINYLQNKNKKKIKKFIE